MQATDFAIGDEKRHKTGRFTEKSASIQWTSIVVIITLLTGGLGAIVLWAADARIDQKYATDKDVQAVQKLVAEQVEIITSTVKQNTKTVRATAASVDGLTLVVLDLRIRDLDDEIIDLRRSRDRNPSSWSSQDERSLRDRLSALSDMQLQRNVLFQRALNSTP